MITFFLVKNRARKRKKMDVVVDPMFDDLEMSLSRELSQYIVNVSQVKNSFYVVVGKPRGNILGSKKEKVFDVVENVSKNIL